MRIFYASDTTPNAAFMSNLWRNNLYLPLVDLGHDVVEFNYDLRSTFQNLNPEISGQKKFIQKNRPKLTEELLRQIKKAHNYKPVDLFFSYFYDACVLPEAIDEIRSLGIKTVNWYCNGSYQLYLVKEISSHYDWCLVPEKFRLKDYEQMGARPIYCQEAANPNIYKPYDLPKDYEVTFIGQAYGERPLNIRYLLDHGIDIHVWGYGWKNYSNLNINQKSFNERLGRIKRKIFTKDGWQLCGRKFRSLLSSHSKSCPKYPTKQPVILEPKIIGGLLSDLEMIKMYSRSKINLGFSTCGETHLKKEKILQIRLRDFEVPMSGGFYMVEYMEELEEYFNIGKEIICYYNMDDLIEKIKYYLSHEYERETIRQAGYERCRLDHSWQKRFTDAFRLMKLS